MQRALFIKAVLVAAVFIVVLIPLSMIHGIVSERAARQQAVAQEIASGSFGKQIFALNKGRSVVPHGHDNMCTGFIILRGSFVGKHYDRVEDHKDHYLIRPTIDRPFRPGECSTVSDHKDNVHWFKAETDGAFIFNVHVMNYNPENKKSARRVYVDLDGEKTAGGLIVARKMTSADCHKKYG